MSVAMSAARPAHHSSLRVRLARGLILSVTVFALTGAGLLFYLLASSLRTQAVERAQSLADAVRMGIAVSGDDVARLSERVDSLAALEGVVKILVLRGDPPRLWVQGIAPEAPRWGAAYPVDWPALRADAGRVPRWSDLGGAWWYTKVLDRLEDQPVAIIVHLDTSAERRRLVFGALILCGGLWLAALLIAMLVLRWVESGVLRPVRAMAQALERRTAGESAARAPVLAGDALGVLARRLNALMDAHDNEKRWSRQRDTLLEGTTDFVALIDAQGQPLYLNRAARRMTGLGETPLEGCHLRDFLSPEAQQRLFEQAIPHALDDGFWSGELALSDRQGGSTPLSLLIMTLREPDGRLNALACVGRDIGPLRQAEADHQLAAQVFLHSREAIVITDPQRRILAVNPAFCTMTGYTAEEVIGHTPRMLNSGRSDRAFYNGMWARIAQQGHWQGEIWNRRKSGEIYPEWLSISEVRNGAGEVTHYIGLAQDISERKVAEARIERLAFYDPLTDLPNRSLLEDRAHLALAEARREETEVSLLFLDLDRFKNINDTLGHMVGDLLLQQVAERLRGCVREADTISRLGGDEFILLLPGAGQEGAGRVAEDILARVSEAMELGVHRLTITPSVGISVFPHDGEDLETLLKHADTAMYHAKEAGRNAYQFFMPSMNQAAAERVRLEAGLRHAIERGELSLVYQPQVALEDGRLVGAEALLRWTSAELGGVSPARFIPVAEETGLIVRFGAWVMNEACRQMAVWREAGLDLVPVAVNLSARQFQQPGLADAVARACDAHGIAPALLELELTESTLMRQQQAVLDNLDRLSGAGHRLAIDDFGTGYSNLGYLRHLPIHKLKIDQSFVRDIQAEPDEAVIVNALIGLAHGLGLQVVAEGVETPEQRDNLHRHACDVAQGYHYARPLPPEAFAAWLART